MDDILYFGRNTDAELARVIHARISHELGRLPALPESREIVKQYMHELILEIIAEKI